jgi:hypothetical protein
MLARALAQQLTVKTAPPVSFPPLYSTAVGAGGGRVEWEEGEREGLRCMCRVVGRVRLSRSWLVYCVCACVRACVCTTGVHPIQGSSLSNVAFLESADVWIGDNHLFKRSVLLIKVLCQCSLRGRLLRLPVLCAGALEATGVQIPVSFFVVCVFFVFSSAACRVLCAYPVGHPPAGVVPH